jgi:biotin synthase
MTDTVRHDWTRAEIRDIHDSPLLDLVFRAATVHRQHHDGCEMQVCKLISIKTGACPEDCAYCAQSSRYETDITPQALLNKDTVMEIARRAKENGVSRHRHRSVLHARHAERVAGQAARRGRSLRL